MTPDELSEIEAKNDRLYALYNDCAQSSAGWTSSSVEVKKLMGHLDSNFPGYDVCLLIKEVRDLQNQILDVVRSNSVCRPS